MNNFRKTVIDEVNTLMLDQLEIPHNINLLWGQIETGDDLASRKTFPLHVTASAVILDTTKPAVLLVWHAFLRKWVFPGGHLDPGELLADAAAREAREETGLSVGEPARLLNIDIHEIPANPSKKEPAHYHCDFRYLFEQPIDRQRLAINDESLGFLWADDEDMLAKHWVGPERIKIKIANVIRWKRMLRSGKVRF